MLALSTQSMQALSQILLWVTAVAGGAAVITGLLSSVLANEASDAVQGDANRRIADANARGQEALARGEEAKAEAALARENTARLEREAATLRLDLEREKQARAPRVLTQAQYEILASLRGKVRAANVTSQSGNIEASALAFQIVSALTAADIEVRMYPAPPGPAWTGNIISLPRGTDIERDPLVQAFKKAGMEGAVGFFEMFPGAPADIPMIAVGERHLAYVDRPYFGPPKVPKPQK